VIAVVVGRIAAAETIAMKRAAVLALALAGIGLTAGSAAVFGLWAPGAPAPKATIEPAWAEAKWPFLLDQWGIGRAFVCEPAACGVKVEVTIRPKIGFCNCSAGVYDDSELERVADTDLKSRKFQPLGPSRPIKVGWMYGLSRPYVAIDEETGAAGERLISVAFNDECDAVVALAALGSGDPDVIEPAVIDFLKTRSLVLWVKKELGLEYVYREF
jgi:hypothetical protein